MVNIILKTIPPRKNKTNELKKNSPVGVSKNTHTIGKKTIVKRKEKKHISINKANLCQPLSTIRPNIATPFQT